MSARIGLGRADSKRQTERVLVTAVVTAARELVHAKEGVTLASLAATVRAYEDWERRRPNRARRGPGAAS